MPKSSGFKAAKLVAAVDELEAMFGCDDFSDAGKGKIKIGVNEFSCLAGGKGEEQFEFFAAV